MSENKRVTIPFLVKVLKPIIDLIKTKADKADYCIQGKDINVSNIFINGKPLDEIIEEKITAAKQ